MANKQTVSIRVLCARDHQQCPFDNVHHHHLQCSPTPSHPFPHPSTTSSPTNEIRRALRWENGRWRQLWGCTPQNCRFFSLPVVTTRQGGGNLSLSRRTSFSTWRGGGNLFLSCRTSFSTRRGGFRLSLPCWTSFSTWRGGGNLSLPCRTPFLTWRGGSGLPCHVESLVHHYIVLYLCNIVYNVLCTVDSI